ncbi:MAG: M56 family metallopeptidase [Bdellovibrionota bacterium]
MSFDTAYIFLAIIISTAAIIILIGTSRSIISRISIQPILIHRFCNFVALMTALSPLVYLAAPDHSFTVVSAQTFDSPQQILKSHPKVTHYKNKVMPVSQDTIPYKAIGIIALCLIFLWYFSRYLANARKIYRILNSSIELRSIGKVKVLISGSSDVPFAYRTFRKAYVVVPESLISNLSHLQLAIKHELQHHRQGDTIWSHIAYFIKSLFFWNPLVHLAHSRISEVQELACDEALIGRKGVNTHQYCYCLLTVAENALNSQRRLVGTTGMSMGSSAQQLKWRVEMMSRYDVKNKFKKFVIMGSLTTTIIASVALATSGVVYDRKVTLVEAHELAKSFKESKFPIEVNEAVLGQLNYYVGTPRGREFIKGAIGRRTQYLDMMNRIFARHDAPEELQAIALIESGFL